MGNIIHLDQLQGEQRLDAFRKAHEEGENIRKALIPGVCRLTYDQVMKAFDADPESFTPDAQEYLTKEPSKDMRVLEYIGSTERRDRDGDRVVVSGWDTKEWKRNPAFSWAHNYSAFPPAVGLKAWKTTGDDRALRFLILYPDNLESEDAQKLVDMVFAMYSSSPPMLKAVSVGFRPIEVKFADTDEEREKMDLGPWGVLVKKAELWELAGCLIGSNYDALLSTAKKGFGLKEGPRLLDALGMEIPTQKTTVELPENVDGFEVKPIQGVTTFTVKALTGEDEDAREELVATLRRQVATGKEAAQVLRTMGLEPEEAEEGEQEEETPETPASGPSGPSESDADDDELFDALVDDSSGEDVYLDDGVEDEEEPEDSEEEDGDILDELV